MAHLTIRPTPSAAQINQHIISFVWGGETFAIHYIIENQQPNSPTMRALEPHGYIAELVSRANGTINYDLIPIEYLCSILPNNLQPDFPELLKLQAI